MHKKHTILLIFVLTGLLASFGLSVHADSNSLICCGTDSQLVESLNQQLIQKKLIALNQQHGQDNAEFSLYATVPTSLGEHPSPSAGKVCALVFPVTFPGYRASEGVSEWYEETVFGRHEDIDPITDESASARDILAEASNGKLDFTGDVMPVYEADHLPVYYQENDPQLNGLINDIISYHRQEGRLTDCSKYDSNNDGRVDCLILTYGNGPSGIKHEDRYSDNIDGLQRTWITSARYAHNLELQEGLMVDNHMVESFNISMVGNSSSTVAHEYGHLMGLKDHYTDYVPGDETNTPLYGNIEMMGCGNGVHYNPYYRYLLDWIEPAILPYEEGLKEIELCAYENAGDTNMERAVIFIPDSGTLPYSEFYMAEYRATQRGADLDANIYAGVMLWHVNAAVNDYIFQFANPSNFIAPVYKVGGKITETFVNSGKFVPCFDASQDLYLPGDVFSAESSPSSDFYDGSHTGAYLEVLSMDEEKAVIKAGFVEPDVRPRPTLTLGEVTDKIVDISSGITIPLKYENFDSIEKLNCEWITTGTAKVLSTSKVDEETGEGYIQISSTSGDGTCQLKILPGCAKNGNMYEPYGALSEVFIVDNTPPEITVSYSTTQKTNRPVAVTYTANEDVRETPTRSKTIYARSNAKLMSAQLTDLAGNKGRCSYSIDWIVPDDYVYFTQEENVITAMPVFAKSGTPALNEMLGYAAYKKNGKLMHLEPLTFGRHPTTNILGANFTLLPQYEDCQVEVFVWNRNMKPYFAAEKVT